MFDRILDVQWNVNFRANLVVVNPREKFPLVQPAGSIELTLDLVAGRRFNF